MASLTETHRLAQAKLGADTVAQMLRLWPLLDVEDLDGTYRRWLDAAVPMLDSQRAQSARMAANYYTDIRAAQAPNATPFVPVLEKALDVRAVTTSLLTQGPWKVKRVLHVGRSIDDAAKAGMAGSARAGSRHVLDGGRATILASVEHDPAAHGWARIGSGHTCGFCAMLISRGAVYSEDTAGFRTHDNCHCTVAPVFGDTWTGKAEADRLAERWAAVTEGLSGDDALAAFTRDLEGRTTTHTPVPRLSPPPLNAAQVAEKASKHADWARSAGWDTTIDGRTITGVKPDGSRIVWQLTDVGAWRVER